MFRGHQKWDTSNSTHHLEELVKLAENTVREVGNSVLIFFINNIKYRGGFRFMICRKLGHIDKQNMGLKLIPTMGSVNFHNE